MSATDEHVLFGSPNYVDATLHLFVKRVQQPHEQIGLFSQPREQITRSTVISDVDVYMDGFDFSVPVRDNRVSRFDSADARVTSDGKQVARGVVDTLEHVENGRVDDGTVVHVTQ
jgi:hypothetical protein